MAQSPLGENADLANSLASLWGKVFGSKGSNETSVVTTGGGQRTEQTVMNEDAVNGLIRQIMTGSRTGKGFADIASQGRRAGLYNSPTSTLLNQNFISNVAQDVALASAPKVTTLPTTSVSTNKNTGQTRGVLPSSTQIPALLLGLAKDKDVRAKVGEMIGKKKPTKADAESAADMADQVNPELADTMKSMGEATGFDPAGGAPLPDVPLLDVPAAGVVSSSSDVFDYFSGIDASSFAVDATDTFSALDVASSAGDFVDTAGFAADSFDIVDGALGVAGEAGDFLGGAGDLLGDAAPFVGPAMDIMEGDYTSAALTGVGWAIGGPVGGAVGNIVGEVVGGKVICTELYHQKLITSDLYNTDLAVSRNHIHPTVTLGYHFWARPYVKLMQRSKLATAFIKPFAVAWANQVCYDYCINANDKNKYKSTLFGKILRAVGERVCYLIGAVILAKQAVIPNVKVA